MSIENNNEVNDIIESSKSNKNIDDMWKSFTEGNLNMDAKIKEIIDSDSDMGTIEQMEDISKISSLVKDFNDGKKIKSIYDKFPNSMKPAIYNMAAKGAVSVGTRVNKEALNFVARATLEEIAKEFNKQNIGVEIDDLFGKLYEDIKGTVKDITKEGGNIFMSTIDDRKEAIAAAIDKAMEAGDMKVVKQFQDIDKAYDDSYNLKEFCEFCGKVKIKKFYIEKPGKIFDDFNYKFRNPKYPIGSISECVSILEDHGFDHNDALKLCIAFCIYCANMKPENYTEYVFMYYFIRNITVLDRLNYKNDSYDSMDDRSKAYYDSFINNLKCCIYNFK